MNDTVNERNARALDARNKLQQGEINLLRERVLHLEKQVAMLRSRSEMQEQRVMALLATRGPGPTER